MSRNVFGRITAIAAVALALSLSGCGKKEATKTVEAKVEAKAGDKAADKKGADKGADKKGEAKKAEAKIAGDKPAAAAAAAAAAAGPDSDNITKAKKLVEKMAGKMEEMLKDVEGAGGDQAKIKAIGEKFKAFAEANKSEGEALNKALKPEEKKVVDGYARKRMAPLMGKFMAVMMKNRPAPAAAAPAAAAPAAAAPAAGAVPAGAQPGAAAAQPGAAAPEAAH